MWYARNASFFIIYNCKKRKVASTNVAAYPLNFLLPHCCCCCCRVNLTITTAFIYCSPPHYYCLLFAAYSTSKERTLICCCCCCSLPASICHFRVSQRERGRGLQKLMMNDHWRISSRQKRQQQQQSINGTVWRKWKGKWRDPFSPSSPSSQSSIVKRLSILQLKCKMCVCVCGESLRCAVVFTTLTITLWQF